MSRLETLLLDQKIEDLVLRPDHFFYYKNACWSAPEPYSPGDSLGIKILRLSEEAAQINLGITQPCADALIRLGPHLEFRSHVVVSPMSHFAFEITLRRIRSESPFVVEDFFKQRADSEDLKKKFLEGHSILVAGATGSGKSSLLSALLKILPENERVLILEDTPELPLPNRVSSKLIARTNRYKLRLGAEWNLEQIVCEALRMRPGRLVLGECRSSEALAVCQAQQTGHRGVLTSIHAGSAKEAIKRFSELCGPEASESSLRVWDCVVFLENHGTHERKVSELLCQPFFVP